MLALHDAGSNQGRWWIHSSLTVVLLLLQLLTAWSPLLHSQFPSLIPQKKKRKKSLESIWSGSERERVASAPNWIGAGGHWLCGTMGEWTGKFSLAEVPVIIRHKKGNSPRSNAFSTCFVLSMDCTVRRAKWLTPQPPCKEGLNCNWWGSLWLQDTV